MSSKMTLAEGLKARKRLKGELAKITKKMQESCSYQDSKIPEWDFVTESNNLVNVTRELVQLEGKIAKANALRSVKVPSNFVATMPNVESISLAEAIRWCSEIKSEITLINSLYLKSGSEKSKESVWDDNINKAVYREVETIWISKMTEKQKDETISLLEEMFSSMDRVIERVNNSSTI